MKKRNPKNVYESMMAAFNAADTDKDKVYAVKEAMLTDRELEIIGTVDEVDDRTLDHFYEIRIYVECVLRDAVYCAPEQFFSDCHARIGGAILRQCEIAAINKAYEDGVF